MATEIGKNKFHVEAVKVLNGISEEETNLPRLSPLVDDLSLFFELFGETQQNIFGTLQDV